MTPFEDNAEDRATARQDPPSGSGFRLSPISILAKRIDDGPNPVPLPSFGGCHLRAARALLDWSMLALADASGLSLSTVRRLEESLEGSPSRSQRKAVAALQRAGIRFVSLEDGTLAVGRTHHPG